jgi:hypothetical protein
VRYLTVEKKALILFILLTSVVSSCNSGLSFELLCLYRVPPISNTKKRILYLDKRCCGLCSKDKYERFHLEQLRTDIYIYIIVHFSLPASAQMSSKEF